MELRGEHLNIFTVSTDKRKCIVPALFPSFSACPLMYHSPHTCRNPPEAFRNRSPTGEPVWDCVNHHRGSGNRKITVCCEHILGNSLLTYLLTESYCSVM